MQLAFLTILFGIAWFCFGAIIGSFLNVVALRYNTGRTLEGRSSCFSCGHTLGVLDLIPIFSFFLSSGRCRYCGSTFSWQYPLGEGITGLLFLGVFFLHVPLSESVLLLLALSLLMVIGIYDLRHKIIPDGLAYAFIGLSGIFLIADFHALSLHVPGIWDVLAGPLLFAPFFTLWFVSKGRWIGLGDGKLSFGIGWMLGLSGGIAAVLMAFWIGAAVSLLVLLAQSRLFQRRARLTIKSEIPFAPFLIIGFLIALFFDVTFVSLSSFFIFP